MSMSRRAWCIARCPPRSREAFKRNPLLPTERNPWILSHANGSELNAGERDTPVTAMSSVGLVQSGCAMIKEHRKSPGGIRTTAARPIGCKARQVRLTHAGVGSRAVATLTRRRLTSSGVLPRKADREQLNDERGIKPLPVNDSRDGAGQVTFNQGG